MVTTTARTGSRYGLEGAARRASTSLQNTATDVRVHYTNGTAKEATEHKRVLQLTSQSKLAYCEVVYERYCTRVAASRHCHRGQEATCGRVKHVAERWTLFGDDGVTSLAQSFWVSDVPYMFQRTLYTISPCPCSRQTSSVGTWVHGWSKRGS